MRHPAEIGIATTIVALCALLAGCPIPIPPLGYEASSRGNVPAERPDWLVDGKTTREEVMLRLGTPDAEAWNGNWIGYLSSRHQGGVAFVMAAGGGGVGLAVTSYTDRRLVVWFDGRGIVTKATFEEKECPRVDLTERPGASSPGSCLGFADIGEPANISPGGAAIPTEATIESFYDVAWTTPFYDVGTFQIPRNYAIYRGPVIVTDGSLVASGRRMGERGSGYVRIEFKDIADIARYTFGRHVGLVVKTTAGADYEFTVLAGTGEMIDRDRTDRLIKLVEERLKRPARPR